MGVIEAEATQGVQSLGQNVVRFRSAEPDGRAGHLIKNGTVLVERSLG